jgi:tRNA U38,U39,U40 pseudouridine synthase TruA
MVRKMVGTLLDVGRGKLKPEDIDRLYEVKDRSKSGPTVPPQGLWMIRVDHHEAFRIGRNEVPAPHRLTQTESPPERTDPG